MKNKKEFMRLSLLLIGLFLVFAISCDEEDDSNGQDNVPVVSTKEVTEISVNKATSGGNILDNGGAAITARGVCWSTNENPNIEDNKTEDGIGVGIFTSRVSGLEPNTTYYLRAYASNSKGIGYGSSMSFTTQEGISGSIFTDLRDGKVYQTVVIGDKEWMAENLAYAPSSGNFWAYDNDDANLETYGYLYDWQTALNVCPTGWHLPSDDEWKELEMALGLSQTIAEDAGWRGTDEGSKLAGNADLWTDDDLENNAGFGTSGFAALPGGGRDLSGNFYGLRGGGRFWSATERSFELAWYRHVDYNKSFIGRSYSFKKFAFSVRCLRD